MLLGISSCMINTATYSFAAQAYGDNVEKVVSLFEGFIGIGTTSGPIIGAFVYSQLDFERTFYVCGGMFLPLALLVQCIVRTPKQVRDEAMVKQLQAELKAEEDSAQIVDQFEEDDHHDLPQDQFRNRHRPTGSTGSAAILETNSTIIDEST